MMSSTAGCLSGENAMATQEAQAIDTAEMLEKERRAVEALREKETDGPWLGLALSGGGIRSASFAMGVMQGLHAQGVMKNFDYLSTVSGGGYIGSSLSYFLVEHARRNPENQDFWFPFGPEGRAAPAAIARWPPSAKCRMRMFRTISRCRSSASSGSTRIT
jgi:predicted acylesterase/phospholipase RssA